MLIISDPHFGKTGHFRKSGISVPQGVFNEDLHSLFDLIQFFKPSALLITGDMFHSHFNKEIDHFIKWRKDIAHLPVILVKGNHDILSEKVYQQAEIEIYNECWQRRNFYFAHDIDSCKEAAVNNMYIFTGHIHPAVKVQLSSKQTARLPCFYFGKDHAILPAFSLFTGGATIDTKDGDTVFGITKKELIRILG